MRVITLDINKVVISVKEVGSSYVLESNDIVSELGEMGQIQQEDGTFIAPTVPVTQQQPTIEERMDQLQQDNLILMDALASTYEEILNLKAQLGGTA